MHGMVYRHWQTGWLVIVLFAAVLGVVVFAGFAAPEGRGLVWPVGGLFVALLSQFFGLGTRVDGAALHLRFGLGLIRKSIPLAAVRAASRVRNSAWMGWGIRYTGTGWMWNIGGLDAVELELEGGRRFRIGTDDPDGLLAALRAARPDRR